MSRDNYGDIGARYFVYISDSKLNMFYNQINHSRLLHTSKELTVKLPLISGGVKRDEEIPETQMRKLQVVTEYIRNNCDVGPADSDCPYIEDTIEMKWGPIWSTEVGKEGHDVPFAFFGGFTPKTEVALAGSKQHLLGGSPNVGPSDRFDSLTLSIMVRFSEYLDLNTQGDYSIRLDEKNAHSDLVLVSLYTHQFIDRFSGSPQRLSFLARRLLYGKNPLYKSKAILSSSGRERRKILLGTPLWVCLAD
jgi:hypothetical protein